MTVKGETEDKLDSFNLVNNTGLNDDMKSLLLLLHLINRPKGKMTISGVEYVALAYWTQVMDTFFAGDVWFVCLILYIIWEKMLKREKQQQRWINIVGIAIDGSNLAIVYVDCTNGTLQSDYWEEDWFGLFFIIILIIQ